MKYKVMEWHSVKVGKIMEITDEEFKDVGVTEEQFTEWLIDNDSVDDEIADLCWELNSSWALAIEEDTEWVSDNKGTTEVEYYLEETL
jgi:hypothetical protein